MLLFSPLFFFSHSFDLVANSPCLVNVNDPSFLYTLLSPPLFLFSPLQHRQTAASSQTASKQLLCNIGWVTDWLTWLVTSGSLPGLAGREKHGLGLDRAEAGCWVLGGNDICLYSRHSTRDCLITTLCTQNSKYITF